MGETIRAFICVPLNEKLKEEISDLLNFCVKKSSPQTKVKWSASDKIHITIKFLGQTPLDHIDRIKNILHGVCEKRMGFTISVRGMGCFPNERRPRVLWIGLDRIGELAKISEEIEMLTSDLGYKIEDREYKPHITLGRVKFSKCDDPFKSILEKYREHHFSDLVVNEIILMQSELKPDGPVYTPIERVSLLVTSH